MAILVASLLIVGGWCAFSLCAGFVVYRASMTRKGAVSGLRKNQDLNAHGKDPIVMDRINEAKARWDRALSDGSIERLSIASRDGLRLCGYYVAAGQKSGSDADFVSRSVILVHGLRDSAEGMAYLAEEYCARGWNVLSVDLRSHGESGGSVITMGVLEGRDLSRWVGELAARHDCDSVFLHGVSMGANAVLSYAFDSRHATPRVKGLIVDSFFPSYRDVAVRLLARVVGNRLIARGIAWGSSVVSTAVTGVRFGRMDAKPASFRPRRPNPPALPILAFHGGRDAIVPVESVESLFADGAIPNAELVVIDEAPHIGAYFYGRDNYLTKIDTFSRRFS